MTTSEKFKATPLGVATHSLENTAVDKMVISHSDVVFF